MRTANRWLLFGVIIAGLVHGHASLQAQPASDPAPTGDAPAPTGDAPVPTGDEHLPTSGAPVPAGSPSAPWNRGVSAESRRAARALLLEGNQLFQNLLFARAAEKYVAALSKWQHPMFYFNLAQAQVGLGQEVEAHESLERALAHGAEPLGVEQFREAQKQLREVERELGQIRVTCQAPGAEVTLDGVTLFIGPGSYQGWAKAKAHELTAKKAGYLSEARRVTVSAGKVQDIELKLVTLGQATDASRRWAAWKPWAVVAAGGLIAAAGGGLHAFAFRNFNDYDDQFRGLECATEPPGAPPGCTKADIPQALNDQLGRARQQQAIAVGAYIAGGSLMAAGVVLLYLNQPRSTEQRAASSPGRSMAVAPAISGDMLGVLVSVGY